MPVIIFNGPPGCGKDAACLLFEELGYKHLSFKEELFIETFKFFDVSRDWFMKDYENRSIKEKPVPELKLDEISLSRRDAMIYVSEQYIKPKYGKDYFGKQLSKHITSNKNFCISDGGFEEELTPIINKIGSDNIVLVQLTRDGCNFSSDSRKYFNGNIVEEYILNKKTEIPNFSILPRPFNISTYRVHNNGSLSELHATLKTIHEKERNVAKIKTKSYTN
jgi:hypothetical protein